MNKHSKRPCPRQGPGSWGGASVLPGPAQQMGWAGKRETGWLPFVPLTPSLHLFSPGTMHPHTWFSFLRAESQCRNAQCAIIPLPALLAASSLWRRPHDLDDSAASPLPPFSFRVRLVGPQDPATLTWACTRFEDHSFHQAKQPSKGLGWSFQTSRIF